MCNVKSGIVFRTGELFTSPFTDSHEDLILLRGLKDDRAPIVQNWARVEYLPDSEWKTWTLSLDEQQAPAWWDDDMRTAIIAKFEALIEGMTITGTVPMLLGGQYILRGNANVAKLGNGAHVVVMRDSSNVGEMWGSSTVGEMRESSNVGEMRESSKVVEMRESSNVGVMWESSNVGEMWGSSKVVEMRESSKVGVMGGSSKAPRKPASDRRTTGQ